VLFESRTRGAEVKERRTISARRHEGVLPNREGTPAPRIAVFQAEWAVQVHTVNPVRVLAESGFSVDLFLYRAPEDWVAGELDRVEGVRVFRLGGPCTWRNSQKLTASRRPSPREMVKRAVFRTRPLKLLYEKARDLYRKTFVRHYPAWLDRTSGLMPAWVVRQTLRMMKDLRYRALIGVEKAGLVWAGQIAERVHVPYLYHNLQLFTKEYYGRSILEIRDKCLMHAEKKYHRNSLATIIQDKARGDVLFADNKVKPERVLYVPVSLLGPSRQARASYLQDRFNLGKDQILILQFGYLHSRRYCVDLARLAQDFPEQWALVMHGFPASDAELAKIRTADSGHRVLFSLDLVEPSRVWEVASSVHIGLSLNRPTNVNDRLVVNSSERVALFLQCGVPIVAFDNPGFEILEQRRCGVVIGSIDELPAAIERILPSWDEYSANARALYDERYEFRKNYRKVIDLLGNLA
jgi:glycosyltransferase involved in cell wall biosynthesis